MHPKGANSTEERSCLALGGPFPSFLAQMDSESSCLGLPFLGRLDCKFVNWWVWLSHVYA